MRRSTRTHLVLLSVIVILGGLGGCGDGTLYEENIVACEDGLDNDGDGRIDCEDPGCQRYPFCDPSLKLGCGDGTVAANERCDTAIPAGQPGACPTSCDDGNPCTVDLLEGAGGCSATCQHLAASECKSGDGCCPAGCDAKGDGDCSASCGNGTLEEKESCDTGIPAGKPGACPAQCDDGNPCTANVLLGGGTCSASCTFPAVTACQGGDGCCPLGCDGTSDPDCSPSCGNGSLEEKESCDTGIPAGQAGACPTSCDDGSPCTKDALLNAGTCSASCASSPVSQCQGGDGCCPTGCTAQSDGDCSATCGDGVLDPKETCDTKIPAGQAGVCPQSCDDGIACTVDTLVGGGTCTASCLHTALAACKDSDGCCPAGCDALSDGDCSPSCGNGVLEPNEGCDTKIPADKDGACPTEASCADGIACTLDTLVQAGTCSAICVHASIAQCKGGDGCCPGVGCNAANDSDCSATCGNGVLEPKETCDTKIPAGQPGACPQSCDDGNPCTADLVLSPATCSAVCFATPISLCQSGDGCCPSGCNAVSDGDCSASCGNGVLEPKETCDIKIPAGQTGACPESCNDGNPCTTDLLLNPATCAASCAQQTITTCSTKSDGCCPSGCNAVNDLDCSASCGNGVLEPKETCDIKIPVGQPGACPQSCDDGSPCTGDSLLNGGTCTATCVQTPVVSCSGQKSDGCCPTGCNAATDVDCSPSCGNGVLEPKETCDTKIAVGQPGACPESCNDGKPCTKDTLVNGGTCTATCSYQVISTCSGKTADGCCPSGCTSLTDADCTPVCGNAVVEAGETCDIKIPAGVAGACPTLTSCDDGNLCTGDKLANAGTCQAQCVHSTPPTCNDGNLCTDDQCNPKTGKCENIALICNDLSLCTKDSCDPKTGQCLFLPAVTCNDGNLCTSDKCDPKTGKCVYLAKLCNDGNLCTVDTCNPKTGACSSTPKNCNDNNVCTLDGCDPGSGTCLHKWICPVIK